MLKKSIVKINQPLSLEIIVTEKKIKSLILKYKDGKFHLSKPSFVSNAKAKLWLESLPKQQYEKLMQKSKQKQSEDFIYIFGKKYHLQITDLNIKKVVIKEDVVHVYDQQYLDTYLKQLLYAYVTKRIQELHMVSFDVHVDIQKMKSKYGCCFYTKQRIKLASSLIHEPKVIIDSVIIHELAHFYYPNHQKEFYEKINQYDANYKMHHAFLKAGGVGDDPICK